MGKQILLPTRHFLVLLFSTTLVTLVCAQQGDGQLLIQNHLRQKTGTLKPNERTIESITVVNDYVERGTGIRHIYASQKVNGLTVSDGAYSLHIKGVRTVDASNIIDLGSLPVKPVSTSISAETAIQALMHEINYSESRVVSVKSAATGIEQYTVFSRNNSKIWDIPCRLVYYHNKKNNSLLPAWEVQMMDVFKRHYWQAFIDANSGKILQKKDLVIHCDFGGGGETDADASHKWHSHTLKSYSTVISPSSKIEKTRANRFKQIMTKKPDRISAGIPNDYFVFDMPYESPLDGDPLTVTTGGNINASVDGWHKVGNAVTYNYTRGNNAYAFYDPSPGPLGGAPNPASAVLNNSGPLGSAEATEPFGFNYPYDLTQQPANYRNGAIVNLFYWNNLIHDVFYQFGFDEVGGNFEASHIFSTGTKGTVTDEANDEVWAQAQDGGGTNNANMLTLQDGINGQMQMYLWKGSTPDSLVQISHSSTNVPPDSTRYYALQGAFGQVPQDLYANPVLHKQFVIVEKNALSTVGTSSQGCTTGQQSVALPPNNNVTDKIVLIDRGSCSFSEKVLGAQQGGAAGVIIINNVDGPPISMGATDPPQNAITIPAVMVTKSVGEYLKSIITGGATITGSLKRKFPLLPDRDGDLDNGVIAHEYGHGISTRLTGGPDGGSLSGDEQGGEGWSDFIGLYMTLRTNDLAAPTAGHPNGVLPTRSIGNYVTYQPIDGAGIRPAPYSIDMNLNPFTYKDIGRADILAPHGVGSIWCTMMYEMLQEFIDQYGFNDDVYNAADPVGNNVPVGAGGNNVAMRLIIQGMKLQPNNPTFVQMRDAILDADTLLYNGQHACRIWRAFAKRGLGFVATAGTNGKGDENENFNVPLSCDPNQRLLRITKTGPGLLTNGSSISYTITVTNRFNVAAAGVKLRDTLPSGMSFSSAVPAPSSVSGQRLEWLFDMTPNEVKTFTLNVFVSTPQASQKTFSDDHETSSSGWTASTIPPVTGLGPWTYTTNPANAYSGSKYWFSENICEGGQESILTKAAAMNNLPANARLIFIHKYATESAFDGGVVEVSTDGGLNWVYIPTNQFDQNGYNAIIPTANTPQIGNPPTGLAAFSGTSPGYIVSIAKLDAYAGMNVLVRFRMVADQLGTCVTGWFIDDVLVLSNVVQIGNSATVYGIEGEPVRLYEGTNARNSSNAFIISSVALPAGLGNLSARVVNNNKVDLKWSNNNDEVAERYIIERKQASDPGFLPIGSVVARAAAGDQQYAFTDPNVATGGKYYYRVQLENKNGQKFYTNIAFAQMNAGEFTVDVYPNPAKDLVNIRIKNPSGGPVTFRVFDVMGKFMGNYNAGAGTSISVPMAVSSFPSGSYWIEIQSGDNTAITRMVISR